MKFLANQKEVIKALKGAITHKSNKLEAIEFMSSIGQITGRKRKDSIYIYKSNNLVISTLIIQTLKK